MWILLLLSFVVVFIVSMFLLLCTKNSELIALSLANILHIRFNIHVKKTLWGGGGGGGNINKVLLLLQLFLVAASISKLKVRVIKRAYSDKHTYLRNMGRKTQCG